MSIRIETYVKHFGMANIKVRCSATVVYVHNNSRSDVAVDNRAHVDTAFLTQKDS